MREIKFRVWNNNGYMTKPFTLNDVQEGKVKWTDECPVMQFTGLHDKNGKEIYEGDVVVSEFGCFKPCPSLTQPYRMCESKTRYTSEVSFNNGMFVIKDNNGKEKALWSNTINLSCKVIGNQYQDWAKGFNQ